MNVEDVSLCRAASIDSPLGALVTLNIPEREPDFPDSHQMREDTNSGVFVTGTSSIEVGRNDTLCMEGGVNPELSGALYELYYALGGDVDDKYWTGPPPPGSTLVPLVGGKFPRAIPPPPVLHTLPFQWGVLGTFGMARIFGLGVESMNGIASILLSRPGGPHIYSVAVPAWAWKCFKSANGFATFVIFYGCIQVAKKEDLKKDNNFLWIDSPCTQWDAESFRALWLLAARQSDRLGFLSLPLNPIYTRLLETVLDRTGLLNAVKCWKEALAVGTDGWVWRFYSIGFAWLHWMAKPFGMQCLRQVVKEDIANITDLVLTATSCYSRTDWVARVEAWAEFCTATGEFTYAFPARLDPKESDAPADVYVACRAEENNLLPIEYVYKDVSAKFIKDAKMATRIVECAVGDVSDNHSLQNGPCAGIGAVFRELNQVEEETPICYPEYQWKRNCLLAQEKAVGEKVVLKESQFKKITKQPRVGVGLAFVHTILSDVIIIGRLLQQDRTILISQASGKYFMLSPDEDVNEVVEELSWILRREQLFLQEMFGGCTSKELSQTIVLWLALRGVISAEGPLGRWAIPDGLNTDIRTSWRVKLKDDNWKFEIPGFLQHAVLPREDNLFNVLIKVDERSVLLYSCENEYIEVTPRTLHPQAGLFTRVSNMEGMLWNDTFRLKNDDDVSGGDFLLSKIYEMSAAVLGWAGQIEIPWYSEADDVGNRKLTTQQLSDAVELDKDVDDINGQTVTQMRRKAMRVLDVAAEPGSDKSCIILRDASGPLQRWIEKLDITNRDDLRTLKEYAEGSGLSSQKNQKSGVLCRTFSGLREALTAVKHAKMTNGLSSQERNSVNEISAWGLASAIVLEQVVMKGVLVQARDAIDLRWCRSWVVQQNHQDEGDRGFDVDLTLSLVGGLAMLIDRDALIVRISEVRALSFNGVEEVESDLTQAVDNAREVRVGANGKISEVTVENGSREKYGRSGKTLYLT